MMLSLSQRVRPTLRSKARALSNIATPEIKEQLAATGINTSRTIPTIFYNLTVPELYEASASFRSTQPRAVDALPAKITDMGALAAYSGLRTGRVPQEKRIVFNEASKDIWWGPVNIPLEESSYEINRNRAVDYLNTRPRLYVVDGFAGWDPKYRIKVRVVACRAYHALFMRNMLMRPQSQSDLDEFVNDGPDFNIFNAGEFPANPLTKGMSSITSVDVNLGANELVILGTQYAGEMKKGVFGLMHYLMPKVGVLSLHSSATCNADGEDTTLLFGLSGTGKTTLSADPKRQLIGDDEHCWSDDGVFNIEGGCYAKCLDLTAESEPDIFNAIRFGSVLENVELDEETRAVDFHSSAFTQNTRLCYPIEYMNTARIPCISGHPENIIFLTCDAFGVLPPVSKLTSAQAMYHFIAGYTAKVAGTEVGVTEPEATFSACFGEAFLAFHPTMYAEMLAEKVEKHGSTVWLVNTGWAGGAYGEGKRMSLKNTRKIIDGIHDGSLAKAETEILPVFNLEMPVECNGVPSEFMVPYKAWSSRDTYDATLNKLAGMFSSNFRSKYGDVSEEIKSAGPY
jgi:phosphoenolpyruvate carboxykinase (ATP)